jgi:hypothetical protein
MPMRLNTIRRFTSLPAIDSPAAQQLFKEHKGVLEIDSVSPPPIATMSYAMDGVVRKIAEWMPTHWRRKENVRPVHWAFVENRVPMAFATVIRDSDPPYDLVVMSQGIFGAAEEIFNRMFSHPENFKSIGKPSRETAPPPIDAKVDPLRNPTLTVIPKCPIRANVAQHLARLSLELTVFHEFTHLGHGHLDYLHATNNWGNASIRQTTEMDADAGCVSYTLLWGDMMHRATAFREHEYPGPVLMAAREVFGTSQKFTLAILLAGYFFFRHMAKPWSLPAQFGKAWHHPLAAIRMRFLADSLGMYVNRNRVSGYSHDQFMADVGSVYNEAELAYSRIFGIKVDSEVWKSAFIGPARDDYFFGSLIPTYARLRPELMKYAKVAELPPVEWDNVPERYRHLMPPRY